jgi:hypothetical protein
MAENLRTFDEPPTETVKLELTDEAATVQLRSHGSGKRHTLFMVRVGEARTFEIEVEDVVFTISVAATEIG